MLTVPRKVSEVLRLRAGDEVKIGIVNIGSGGTMTVDRIRNPTTKRKAGR